jgi:hypothetical protein
MIPGDGVMHFVRQQTKIPPLFRSVLMSLYYMDCDSHLAGL